MTRILAMLALALLLGTACGHYGPPVRSAPPAVAQPSPAAAAPALATSPDDALDEEQEKSP